MSYYMIYFIKGQRFCKIGYSKNPEARLKELQTGCPFKLVLKATMPGCFATEAELHKIFEKQRVNGEWFRYDGPVLRAILGIIDKDGPYYPVKTIKQLLLASEHRSIRSRSKRTSTKNGLNRRLKVLYEEGDIKTMNKSQTRRFE